MGGGRHLLLVSSHMKIGSGYFPPQLPLVFQGYHPLSVLLISKFLKGEGETFTPSHMHIGSGFPPMIAFGILRLPTSLVYIPN